MVFKSKNLFRKCKYCQKERKKNFSDGRNHGYYTTCGSKECLKGQYNDHHVCALKGRIKNPVDYECILCEIKFSGQTSNHKRYCKECVPDKTWRQRAKRYRIGKPQWDSLLEKQNFKCALCDNNPEVVDHCHKNGFVRGLLCNGCNIKLTTLDNDNFLEKALKYIGK